MCVVLYVDPHAYLISITHACMYTLCAMYTLYMNMIDVLTRVHTGVHVCIFTFIIGTIFVIIYLCTSVYLRLLGKHACLSTKGCHLVLWGYRPVRGFILVHHY